MSVTERVFVGKVRVSKDDDSDECKVFMMPLSDAERDLFAGIVRCRDCVWFRRNATPHDTVRPHFCAELGIDLVDGDGFCAWGKTAGDE